MNDAKHYSIWLTPTGAVRDQLSELIARLSREFSAPLFPPHVTLVGGLSASEDELREQTRELAARLQPYSVQLGALDYLDEFYRCLFVRVEPTPAVMEANRQARAVFHCPDHPQYLPHLSLLYGNFERARKEEVIARIGTRLDDCFNVNRIHLHSTLGETRDWYPVGEFTL